LHKRDNTRLKLDKPRGILNVPASSGVSGHARYWPSEALAPFVEHHWRVRWNVEEAQRVETLPHPSVHMVIENGCGEIAGVTTERFSRLLEGRGGVIGTKFRPGGFRAFVDRRVSAFTNRRTPSADVFGTEALTLAARVHECGDDDRQAVDAIESFLRALNPKPRQEAELCATTVASIASDRTITRVDQIADASSISVRRLQRLYDEYVGATPKWVIQRYRLIEAAERIAAGELDDWATLALDLGFSDQAHFIRGFKKLVGRTPADYARSLSVAVKRVPDAKR
jgi:AraC-like DNA-binding protein